MPYRCTRKEKPEVCKLFPRTASEIKEFPSCTYYFEDGERKGYCSWCGECCTNIYLAEFGKKFTGDKSCPYLKETADAI